MIDMKRTKQKCREDVTLIENYSEAVASDQIFDCHHRLETHFSDGTERPVRAQLSRDELMALGVYYNRPASELIFLSHSEHTSLHNKGNSYGRGQICSEEHKRQISNANTKWEQFNYYIAHTELHDMPQRQAAAEMQKAGFSSCGKTTIANYRKKI